MTDQVSVRPGSFPTIQPLMISYVIDGKRADPPAVVVPEVATPRFHRFMVVATRSPVCQSRARTAGESSGQARLQLGRQRASGVLHRLTPDLVALSSSDPAAASSKGSLALGGPGGLPDRCIRETHDHRSERRVDQAQQPAGSRRDSIRERDHDRTDLRRRGSAPPPPAGVEVEHSTIPPYEYAMWSVVDPDSAAATSIKYGSRRDASRRFGSRTSSTRRGRPRFTGEAVSLSRADAPPRPQAAAGAAPRAGIG